MGLLPGEFYDLTWGEYHRAALGYRIREDRQWDRARSIMWAAIQPHSKKRVSPTDFYRCIWDAPVTQVTKEEAELMKKAWKLN